MENSLKIVKLEEQMETVSKQIDSLDKKLDHKFEEMKKEMRYFVRREEFTPYKRGLDIVFGVVVTAVVGGVLALIFI